MRSENRRSFDGARGVFVSTLAVPPRRFEVRLVRMTRADLWAPLVPDRLAVARYDLDEIVSVLGAAEAMLDAVDADPILLTDIRGLARWIETISLRGRPGFSLPASISAIVRVAREGIRGYTSAEEANSP